MTPLTRADLLPNAEFLARRRQLEAEVIAAKSARRITVGGHLTFLFENRFTLWWQVQEMCRVERITDERGVQHELDTYNALGGTDHELAATLMVEYADPAERALALEALVGLHTAVRLEVGDELIPGRFDAEQWNDRRISAVQFARFTLPPGVRSAFFDLRVPARIVVAHAALSAVAPLGAILRGALCEDLAEGAPRQ